MTAPTLDDAVSRIKEGLGFRVDTTRDASIIKRIQEAQRSLERGKTLPSFLLQEDATISLVAGTNTVALPTGFIRGADAVDNPIQYFLVDSTIPIYIPRKKYAEAQFAYYDADPSGPKVYSIRKSNLYFWPVPDANYTLYWAYYKADDVLVTGTQSNLWLANAYDYLVAESGLRIALSLRNKNAIDAFKLERDQARADLFAEIVLDDESDGPMHLSEDY